MRRSALAGIAAALLLISTAALGAEELVDGIAAQVGSDIVLVSEVIRMVEPIEAKLRKLGGTELDVAKIRAEGLERMIEWRLIEQVVHRAELFATEAEIDETIRVIAQQNGLSPEQLRASLAAHGLTYQDYRLQIKRELERRKVVDAMVRSQVRLEEEAVHERYTERYADQPQGGVEVHLRQLLIAYGRESGVDRETACELVRRGRERVRAGESFAAVAAQLSEVAPAQGGDIGWLLEASLAPWMSKLVTPLQPGETSEVAVLPFGCNLFHLVERREFEPVTYEMAKPALQEEIFQELMADQYTKWMEDLREKTFIERYGYFAQAARLGESTFIKDSDPLEQPTLP